MASIGMAIQHEAIWPKVKVVGLYNYGLNSYGLNS